jgi:aminoglycoside phosphotransferase (APT) family kinase protein
MAVRTPRELIEIYWDRVYNNMEVDLVREVCADPILRHDPAYVTPLTHDEQIARIRRIAPMRPLFTHQVLHADDTYVTSVWNMISRDGKDYALCGIEVFRAENGRFTDCWNSTYMKGFWGEAGDLFDPAKLSPPPLIASPAEIDADWLQRAFAAGGAVPTQRIASLAEVAPIGAGTSEATVRVRVGYNAGHVTAPTSAVCKIGRAPARGANAVGPFVREARAYQLFGRDTPFRTPRLYYAATDETGGCNLVLEDLTGVATAGDQIAGCSVGEAAAVTRELARLHRAYWRSPQLDRLDWLSEAGALVPSYAAGAAVLSDWLAERIAPAAFETIEAFGRVVGRWRAATPTHRTLVHGDPRVDNVLFERTGDGEVRACLIDWQEVGAGDPQYDLAYFLSGSLAPEDRRASERGLVAEHARIVAEADPGYTADIALDAYRANIVAGLWLTVVAAAFVPRNDHNAQLLTTLVGRNVAAVEDWDGLGRIGA